MRTLYSEGLKLIYSGETKIVFLLATVCQAFMAYLESRQFRSIGLDATPLTQADLLEAVPPLEYIGFDAALFGIFALVVLGALTGAKEFRARSLRSTLLATPSRCKTVFAKTGSLAAAVILISFLSTYVTLAVAHAGLAGEGLSPVLLCRQTWSFLGWTMISEVLLTLLAFVLAFLLRGATLPLLFLLSQFYLVIYLPAGSVLGKLLPVSLAESLIATSPDAFAKSPVQSAAILLIYVVIILLFATWRICREDLGNHEE